VPGSNRQEVDRLDDVPQPIRNLAVRSHKKRHKAFAKCLILLGGATGDRTPDLMTASDENSRAGITCSYLLLAVVSENGQTGGGFLPVVTPCLLSSTSQFTSQCIFSISIAKYKH
jgi:hypothetical protein